MKLVKLLAIPAITALIVSLANTMKFPISEVTSVAVITTKHAKTRQAKPFS